MRQCQKLLFSATLTRNPAAIAALDLRSPRYLIVRSAAEAGGQTDTQTMDETFNFPASLTERMLVMSTEMKPMYLLHLLHHPEYNVRNALVFTKSVESANRLVQLVNAFEAEAKFGSGSSGRVIARSYTGDMKPADRRRLLDEFAQSKVHMCVYLSCFSWSHTLHVQGY
jgi:ATP-dependent RNA helicase DDX51/DBP6